MSQQELNYSLFCINEFETLRLNEDIVAKKKKKR